MSNQAWLFAEDTPAPCNPSEDAKDPRANTRHLAGAAYQVPAFWLFCFAKEDFVDVRLPKGKFSTLVAPLDRVRRRLLGRDQLAREFFPEGAELWSRWRQVLDAVDRRYLKLDPYEIWVLYRDENELAAEMRNALEWFESGGDYQFTSLLKLAGIEDYDDEERRILFDEEEWCVEKVLIGWFQDGG